MPKSIRIIWRLLHEYLFMRPSTRRERREAFWKCAMKVMDRICDEEQAKYPPGTPAVCYAGAAWERMDRWMAGGEA